MWVVKKRPNIGVSPSGKASDSDSDISGVRIPAPQPKKKARLLASFFLSFGRGRRRAEDRFVCLHANGVRLSHAEQRLLAGRWQVGYFRAVREYPCTLDAHSCSPFGELFSFLWPGAQAREASFFFCFILALCGRTLRNVLKKAHVRDIMVIEQRKVAKI